MRPITLKIAPNERVEIPVMGDYLRLDDSAPTCTVEASSNEASGNYAILKGADAIRFPQRFTRLAFYHGEATEQTVTFDVGFGQLLTSRVAGTVAVAGTVDISGTVQVIDGGKSRTVSGIAFVGSGDAAATAATYAHASLYNPVGSGVRLVVAAVGVGSVTATRAIILSHNAPLANFVRNPLSKYLGGAASVAEIQRDWTATIVSAEQLFQVELAGRKTEIVRFTEPFIVDPGMALVAVPDAVNIAMRLTAEYYEEPSA